MLDSSHAIIGASLAKLIPNPYIGLPVSLISHVICDYFPHWDLNTRKTVRSKFALISLSLTDAFIGFLFGFLLFGDQVSFWYLALMMFTAQLPDWLEAPYHVFDWKFFPFSNIKKFQSDHHNKLDFPWGFLLQFLFVALIVVIAALT